VLSSAGSARSRRHPSCRPATRRRLIHHQTPPPPASRTNRSHSHRFVPVVGVGAWTAGLGVGLAATVTLVAVALVAEPDAADFTGLTAALVTVALTVAVAVAVAVIVVDEVTGDVAAGFGAAGVVDPGALDADVGELLGGAALEAVGWVGGLDAVGWAGGLDAVGWAGGLDAVGWAGGLDADGEIVGGGATLDAGDRVGARVGVGVPGLEGGLTVGTVTVGLNDLVGVGSVGPPPPEPHPAAATTVINNAVATATRMGPSLLRLRRACLTTRVSRRGR
jgi:hypothetical protein